MRIAIVHEWLVNYAGSERVVEQLISLYPEADLFSLVDFLPDDRRDFLAQKRSTTSFIQRLPFAEKRFRGYLPLMPLAVEQFDLSGYDLVLSSSHAVAKGVVTGPDQLHISYVHSPMRYAWDLQHQYLRDSGLDRGLRGAAARWVLHRLRLWDTRTANGVDHFVANSRFIARRIHKVYRRESRVIHPPVDVASFELRETKEDFFLAASRMVPYKKLGLIVEAFSAMPDKKLIVIGDGPEMARIRAKAGKNVYLLGHQPHDVLVEHMQRARALIFAAEEDFGIVPVEAQACGTPVIAFGKGGALETVRDLPSDDPTGVLFESQTVESISEAVSRFERNEYAFAAQAIRGNALRFGTERFKEEFGQHVEACWREFLAESPELEKQLTTSRR